MSYPFPKRPEQLIVAAALLESICRDVEKRCEQAQKEWALQCEQIPNWTGSRKTNEQMKRMLSQKDIRKILIRDRDVNRLADSLLFYFPGRPDTSLEIIRQRTRGLAKQLIVQAAAQNAAQQRFHQILTILTSSSAY